MRTYERNGLYYVREDDYASEIYKAYVAGADEESGQSYAELTSAVIPDTVVFDGIIYKVVGILEDAFRDCQNLKSVTFPDSLKSIGGSAFRGCTGLDSIVIPNGVTSVGSDAFNGCSGLTSIVLHASNLWIGENAFYGCNNLTLTIATGATEISGNAYYGCDFKAVVIPEGVKTIGQDAFRECRNLVSVSLPSTLESIGYKAFNECALDSITIPASVKTIAGNAFDNCRRLKAVKFEGVVENIGEEAFLVCDSLKFNEYGNCRYLGNAANPYMYLIDASGDAGSYQINDSTKTIACRSFGNVWYDIDSLAVPAGVKHIGEYAFNSVKNVYYKGSATGSPWGAQYINPVYDGDFIFSGEEKTILAKYIGEGTEITIPDGVVEISKYAFENKSITSVTMPNSVRTIGESAFSYQDLQTIVLSDSLKSIGENAFAYCRKLNTITIPDGVTTIGNDAFKNVVNIVYEGTATGSPWGARYVNAYIDDNYLYADANKTILGVYLGADNEVVIPNGVKEIAANAFYEKNITSVTISDSVKTIGNSAFGCCYNLAEVHIPSTVETIGSNAFYGCMNAAIICDMNSESKPDGWDYWWSDGCKIVVWKNSTFSVNISANYSDRGYVTFDSATYHYGDTLKLSAVANKGYYFERWDDWNNDNPRTIIVEGDVNRTAEFFEVSPVSVIINSKNTFLGTISGYDASKTYYIGDTLKLSVTTVNQTSFYQWSDGNSDNPRTIVLNGDVNLNAEFNDELCLPDSSGWITIGSYYELTKNNSGKTTQVDLSFSNSGSRWDAQFVTPSFKNLGKAGDAFELSFDVKYSGESDYGMIQIIAGKTIPYNPDYNQATNTQIVDEFGDSRGWGDGDIFEATTEWTRVNYSHYLGAMGADSVRLEFDLGTLAGTYSFRNIALKVADSVVARWFSTGDVYIDAFAESGGSVNGGGYSNNGDTVTLEATPNSSLYTFKQWSDGNTDNPRTVVVNGDATYKAVFDKKYQSLDEFPFNDWWTIGCVVDSADMGTGVAAKLAISEEKANGAWWDAQFCNIFHQLDGQTEGNNVKLSFDVYFDGEADTAIFRIITGKITWEYSPDIHNDYQFSEDNTEILDSEGYAITGHHPYSIAKGKWTNIAVEGTIGEAGADWIGIELDFGGNADNVGDFYFRNMTMTTGNAIKYDYMESDKAVVSLSANRANRGKLSGSGVYNIGDSVTIAATPKTSYEFKQWSDGDTDNPRKFKATGNLKLAAQFDAIPGPYAGKATVLPGNLECENFDEGDDTHYEVYLGTSYEGYRDTDAGIDMIGDNEYSLTWTTAGEWADYTVTVAEEQKMRWAVRVATYKHTNSKIAIYKGEESLTDTIVAPTTDSWYRYDFVSGETQFALPEGTYKLRLKFEEADCNVDKVMFGKLSDVLVTAKVVTASHFELPSHEAIGFVKGYGFYESGSQVTLTASAAKGYQFKRWSDGNSNATRTITVNSDTTINAIFDKAETLTVYDYIGYDNFGRWFQSGGLLDDMYTNQNNEAVIKVDDAGEAWGAQFCVFFHEAQGQTQGNSFSLDFDVMWEGNNADTTAITILSGKPSSDFHADYQWNDSLNTEIIFDGGFWAGQNKEFRLPYGEWKHITWGGTIGEAGADYIGIQINLADTAGLSVGTYRFKNVVVKMNGAIVSRSFNDPNTNLLVSASGQNGTVTGGGYYGKGDEVKLTATPNEGYYFKQWGDGNTKNPRTITVTGNMTFVAQFAVDDSDQLHYYEACDSANMWFYDGAIAENAIVRNNIASIDALDYANNWDAQFCNILTGLAGQEAGNNFQLDFDVKWNSLEGDNATITMLTGKLKGDLHEDYQWDSAFNTELVNAEGNNSGIHGASYQVADGQWTHISWGGTIGEAGADYIGIQINLALKEEYGDNRGTFSFRNMKVRINDSIVKQDFCTGELYVNATAGKNGKVTGSGFYAANNIATLTAEADDGYIFKQWSDGNTDNPRRIKVKDDLTLIAEFISDGRIDIPGFAESDSLNCWFTAGWKEEKAYVKDNIASIFVSAYCDQWAAQFCNILTGLDGQEKDNKFQLDFDVKWNRLDEKSRAATIYLLAGKVMGDIHEDYQWSDSVAELVNAEGTIDGVRYAGYNLANDEWTHVSWGGIITETGAKYIGVEINLGMNETDGDNRGTFSFRNMKVRINDSIVREDFCTGELYVNAKAGKNGKVTGSGIYAKGDIATLAATADEDYYFKQWSDGNTDNPRRVIVNDDITLTAEFATDVVYIPYYAESDSINAWYVNGELVKKAIVTTDNIVSIFVSENGNLWESQFCNILSGLEGQKVGNKFQLDFDINWNGSNGVENANIMMVTNKNGYGDRYDSEEENTELVNANGNNSGIQFATYQITNGGWTHISWGGTIGEKGAQYIGVGIYFNKFDTEADKRGTFNFKNMKVRINDEVVLQDFCTNDLFVDATAGKNGTVTGGGYYTKGDTVTLIATADTNCYFKQWSDGNTDNPRTFVATDDVLSLTAQFGGESKPFAGKPITLPGVIEFEDFDLGANGIAYYDTSEGNELGEMDYRADTDVDVCYTDFGYGICYSITGEWMNYTVTVEEGGIMNWSLKAASGDSVGAISIYKDDVNITGVINVPYTGDWSNYTILTGQTKVALPAGTYTLKLYFENQGCNIDNIIFGNATVNATANTHEDNGVVWGIGAYNNGDTVTLTTTTTEFYVFKRWSDGNTDNPRQVIANGNMAFAAEFEPLNYTSADFPFNTWWATDCELDSVKMGNGYAAKINIDEATAAGNRWDAQFCNIYHEFDGQAEGKSVKFSFDVKFDGAADTAQLSLLTGKLTWDLEPDIHANYQWDEGNTEILDANGNKIVCNAYPIAKGQWQTITVEGTIGEAGARYIGLELDLAGEDSTNNVGDFYFKNVVLTVDGKVITSDYAVGEATIVLAADSKYGTVEGDGTYYIGDTAVLIATANNGYKFIGWSDGDTASVSTFDVTEDLDLTANFVAINYSISYDLNGGSAVNTETYTVESNAFTLVKPEKEGYTFTGWTGTGLIEPATIVTIAQGSTGNREYTANWAIREFTITFNTVDGTAVDAITANFGEEITAPTDPTKDGYVFCGWNPALPLTMPAYDTTCVAMWTEQGETKFVVEHYQKNLDGKSYTLVATDNSKTGKAGATTSVAPNNYTGFSLERIENAEIAADESTVAKVYYSRNIYTLAYDAKGGELSGDFTSDSVLYGAAITAPAAPTKTGYTFTGWNAALPETMPAENLTFTASWTINKHNIVYVADEDTIQIVENVEYGSPILAAGYPTKTGYKFNGWQNVPATMPDSDVTVSGSFTANSYFIAFNSNGGSAVDTITVDYGTAISAPADPTRAGYTFAGWNATLPETMPAENLTFKANWTINTHNIVYVVDGDTFQTIAGVEFGARINTIAPPTKTGYTFGNWLNVPLTMPDSDVTISGSFTINQYTISFNSNGGSTVDAITSDFGTAITAPADPKRTGYTFNGWDKDVPATMPAENVKLNAVWTINKHELVYVVDGKVYSIDTVQYGGSISVIADAIKTGYTFSGWQNVPLTMPDNDVTISGSFTINQYTISFNSNGGSTVDAITSDFGTAITAPADPKRTGYTFNGWDKDVPATMPAENVKLNAVWTINKHQLVYVVDGKVYATDTVQYGDSISVIADATKTGYTFGGWQNVPATMPDTTVTISGSFTANFYFIAFNSNGGSAVDTIIADFGTAITAPAYPTKKGYTFTGWDKDVPATMPAENVKLNAVWSINKYELVYVVDGKVYSIDTVQYGDSIAVIADAIKTGYTFSGWQNVPATMPDTTVTVSGSFTANFYYIAFNSNGGSAVDTIKADFGTAITAPADPTKKGYTFNGWDKDVPATMPAENVKLNAVWTINSYELVYVVDGKVYATDTVQYGDSIVIIADAVKTGYTFSGWQNVPATMPDTTVTVSGSFTANFYFIAFNSNGGTAVDTITADYGTAITAPADPKRTGYTFGGWDKDVPATMPAENVKLNAVWTINKHELVYVVDGKVYVTDTVQYGDSIAVIADATKTGYTFSGWQNVPATMPDTTVTVSGSFTANFYYIAFNSNGGSAVDTIKADFGTAITAPANPTKTGYTFSGWDKDVPATMPAENVKLNAVWIVNTYTLTYGVDGKIYATDTVEYGAAIVAPDSLVKTGYTFAGWNKDVPATMPAENIEFDAVWTINQYTIALAVNNSRFGSVLGAGIYNYGDTATIYALENDDFEFISWNDGETNPVRIITVTEDVNLKATFRKKFIPIQFISGLEFYLTDTAARTAALIGYTDSLTVLNAPAEIEVDSVIYQVTGIGNEAFVDCDQLDSIVIPETVKTIGAYAFANCTGTLSITIPNTVDSIGENAFLYVKNIVYYGDAIGSPWGALTLNGTFDGDYIYSDTSLTAYTGTDTAVVIPDSVSIIGQNAFAGNETVTSVEIPETVNEIGDGAFSGCTNLGSVNIPDGVTSIGNETFANCASLDSVDIPASVTEIGNSAFNGCSSLTVIQIPVSVTVIGSSAFANCASLDSLDIPESVNTLGDSAFTNCTSLTVIQIPVSVTVIGAQTFAGCTSLNNIDIPSATTEIGNGAFDGCSSLTSIAIPTSVTTIGNGAFAYCSSLVMVQIGVAVNLPKNGVTTLADESLSIGSRAFIGCDSLTAIYIPLSVASIGDSAFAGCKNLTIYCEAESMPEGWSESWNPDGCTVVWNYKAEPKVDVFNLTAVANNINFGTVTGSATYNSGATATLTAIAAEGYRFVSWSDGNTDNPRTIVVSDNLSLTAVFEAVITAIDDEEAATVNIFAFSNTIVVENAADDIYVYDTNGRLITIEQSAGQRTEILIANKGVYLVKVGNTAKRVMVF